MKPCLLPAAPDGERRAGWRAGVLDCPASAQRPACTLVLERPAACDTAAVVSPDLVRDRLAGTWRGPAAAEGRPRGLAGAFLLAALALLGANLGLAWRWRAPS